MGCRIIPSLFITNTASPDAPSHRGHLGQVVDQPIPKPPTNQPDHDGNDQYQTKNAAEPRPAIRAVTIVATASEQQNQHEFMGSGRPRSKSLRIWKRGR
jgi:hypothetical protein